MQLRANVSVIRTQARADPRNRTRNHAGRNSPRHGAAEPTQGRPNCVANSVNRPPVDSVHCWPRPPLRVGRPSTCFERPRSAERDGRRHPSGRAGKDPRLPKLALRAPSTTYVNGLKYTFGGQTARVQRPSPCFLELEHGPRQRRRSRRVREETPARGRGICDSLALEFLDSPRMTDLVFTYAAHPLTFLLLSAVMLLIGLAAYGISLRTEATASTSAFGVAASCVVMTILLWGFAAILWQNPKRAKNFPAGMPMELACRTPTAENDNVGVEAYLSLNNMTLTFGASDGSVLPKSGPTTYAVLQAKAITDNRDTFAPIQYSVKMVFGDEDRPTWTFLFGCK